MSDDAEVGRLADPEELVGKDELDEDDEMDLDGAALVDEASADAAVAERAVPILSVQDLDAAEVFYAPLGFGVRSRHEGYSILTRNAVELHLSHYPPHDPFTTEGMVYLRINDMEELYEALHGAGDLLLAPASGVTPALSVEIRQRFEESGVVTRLHEIEDKPWGMREFAVVDPGGNLLRIGVPIATG